MQNSQSPQEELFNGLKLLADTAFPKQCAECGKVYPTLERFLAETAAAGGSTGLSVTENQQRAHLTLQRHCACGALFTDDCDERRSQDPIGIKRRQIFDRLLLLLTESGMDPAIAKPELMTVMRGGQSELLSSTELTKFFS